MAAEELSEAITGADGPRFDGLVGKVALDVAREVAGGIVAAVAVFFQATLHNPIEFALHQGQEACGFDAADGGDAGERFVGRQPGMA